MLVLKMFYPKKMKIYPLKLILESSKPISKPVEEVKVSDLGQTVQEQGKSVKIAFIGNVDSGKSTPSWCSY